MKSPVAYYLLLLYAIVMLRPLIPIISDELEHSFNEAIHVSTVHAIYGNNHLEKELAAASDNDSNKTPISVKSREQVPVHLFQVAFVLSLIEKNSAILHNFFIANEPASVFLPQHSPPPKYC